MKGLFLDNEIKKISKQIKSYGRLRKFSFDFRYLYGMGGCCARLLLFTTIGALLAISIPIPINPYITTTAFMALTTFVPVWIRRKVNKSKPTQDQILRSLYDIKNDIFNTNSLIKEELKDFNKLSRVKKIETIKRVALYADTSVDFIDKNFQNILNTLPEAKNEKTMKKLHDYVGDFPPYKKLCSNISSIIYAVKYIEGRTEFSYEDDLGNRIIQMINNGSPMVSTSVDTPKTEFLFLGNELTKSMEKDHSKKDRE